MKRSDLNALMKLLDIYQGLYELRERLKDAGDLHNSEKAQECLETVVAYLEEEGYEVTDEDKPCFEM
jgi:hypothetical protein